MSSLFPKQLTAKQSCIASLAFFDQLGVPLNRQEMTEFRLFNEVDEHKVDIYLRESPLINFYDGYYSLKGDTDFYRAFELKKKRAKKYWKTVKRYTWLLNALPFVKLVAVCNSLPMRNVNHNSDIDLLIVAEKNKLFTARFFATLLISLFGKRRHGKKQRRRFCLSFYIAENASSFEALALKPTDIYMAFWLKTLEPIAGNYESYEKLMDLNKHWLNPYFPNESRHKRHFKKAGKWSLRLKKWLEKKFQNPKWEEKLKNWQLKRATEKRDRLPDPKGTVITEYVLKFHDNDRRESYQSKWKETLKKYF